MNENPTQQPEQTEVAQQDTHTTGHVLGIALLSGPRAIGGEYVQPSGPFAGYFIQHRFVSAPPVIK